MHGVLIVDDYASMREAVSSLLEHAQIDVCGEAENGKIAVERVEQLHPRVVILDITMPGMNGIEACYEIRRRAPATKIVILTLHDRLEHQALLMGADAFVSKTKAAQDLIPTVQRLISGAT